jgi:hypothetical protein
MRAHVCSDHQVKSRKIFIHRNSRGAPVKSMPFPVFLFLVTFSLSALQAQDSTAAMQAPLGSIYITHATVIDIVAGKELHDRTVVISGDRISEIKDKRKQPPSGANILDAKGKYLIPGLWDMHVHAIFPDRLDSMLPMLVANGVLGIRDMGTSMPLTDIELARKDIRTGTRLGPLIVAAGPILDGRPKPLRTNFLAITTPAEGRDTVDKLSTGGADLIKVYSWLSRDTFLAIADEANKRKIPFGGHVPFAVSALEASDAGMKSMEHLYGVVLSCSARENEVRAEMLKGGSICPVWTEYDWKWMRLQLLMIPVRLKNCSHGWPKAKPGKFRHWLY